MTFRMTPKVQIAFFLDLRGFCKYSFPFSSRSWHFIRHAKCYLSYPNKKTFNAYLKIPLSTWTGFTNCTAELSFYILCFAAALGSAADS